MSGFIGLIHLTGAPLDANLFGRLAERIAYRGDVSGMWQCEPFAIATRNHRHLYQRQLALGPHVDPVDGNVYALCGWLNNRGDLQDALGWTASELALASDQDLAIAAYRRWGQDCAERLVGGVVLVVWSPRDRRLWISRDTLGKGSLHYHLSDRLFIFSSDLRAILEHPDVPREPDLLYMANLVGEINRDRVSTLVTAVKRLSPAHCLTLDEGRVKVRQYWQPGGGQDVQWRSVAAVQEEFATLTTRITADQLRDVRHPAIFLSGGTDSPTVLGYMRRVRQEPIHSFSLYFPGLPCDEACYIRDVVELHQTTHTGLPLATNWGWDYAAEIETHLDLPSLPNTTMGRPLIQAAREQGCHVFFSGGGGDNVCMLSRYAAADLLAKGHAVRAWKVLGMADGGIPRGRAGAIWPLVLKPLIRRALPDWFFHWPGIRPTNEIGEFPGYLRSSFIRGHDLVARFPFPPPPIPYPDFVRRNLYMTYYNSMEQSETGNRVADMQGIISCEPLWDQRMLDFIFRLPPDVHYADGLDKQLLRRSGHLPPSIARRQEKAEFSISFHAAITRSPMAAYASDLRLADLGMLNADVFRHHLDQIQHLGASGQALGDYAIFSVWRVLCLEHWLRRI